LTNTVIAIPSETWKVQMNLYVPGTVSVRLNA